MAETGKYKTINQYFWFLPNFILYLYTLGQPRHFAFRENIKKRPHLWPSEELKYYHYVAQEQQLWHMV